MAIEILAPAGDYETLKAAVCAGADAVYAGGERFGARAYAVNFNRDELLSAIDYVHLHGRKLYLTVNTLVKEREFADLYEYLIPFYQQGLDAVIVQDMGVLDYVRKQFPGLSIHASTQMTVTNVISAKYLESLGVTRVVPARELSLSEIQEISGNTGLEVECFVHGALCYCYSGQCLLSSMIGGRSGNRGQCAQPCRLSYAAGKGQAKDILSLKDLCTIQAIPDLIKSGIDSFKIEGRMKQPEYVAAVTGMYRKYLDLYLASGGEGYHVSEKDIRELERVYQRRGYCDGYYYRHNGKEMLSLKRPKQEERTERIGERKIQEKVNGKMMISAGKHVTLYLQSGGKDAEVTGPVPESAASQPVTKERLEKQLRKTGNTPFAFEEIEISIDGDVFLPIQAVNELRRRGMEALEERILQDFRRERPDNIRISGKEYIQKQETDIVPDCMEISVSVESVEQLEAVGSYTGIHRIYVEDALWAAPGEREKLQRQLLRLRDSGRKVYFAMARIFRQEAKDFYDKHFMELAELFDGVMVRNLESLLYARKQKPEIPTATDSSIYQWNQYAKDFFGEFSPDVVTLPVELNRWELQELRARNMELVVYGYLPVMVSAGCVKKNTRKCDGRPGYISMTDRQNKKNIVKNECLYCYNVIYNSAPLMLSDQYRQVRELGVRSVRLQFSTENEKKTREILDLYTAAYQRGEKVSAPKGDFTRGHFKRGVK